MLFAQDFGIYLGSLDFLFLEPVCIILQFWGNQIHILITKDPQYLLAINFNHHVWLLIISWSAWLICCSVMPHAFESFSLSFLGGEEIQETATYLDQGDITFAHATCYVACDSSARLIKEKSARIWGVNFV